MTITQGLSTTGGHQSSGPGIEQLSPALRQVVKDAYQYGVKWAFYSLLPWCCLSALAVFTLGKIVDSDREEKEARERAEKEAEQQNEKLGPSTSGGVPHVTINNVTNEPMLPRNPESGVANASSGTDTGTTDQPKPKKQVGHGPRYRGPFMYVVYGAELLIGTRQRRPKAPHPALRSAA